MKTYLGDAVYVDVERGMVKLTTENGVFTTNTIYLEPEVLAAFERYVSGLRYTAANPNPPKPPPEET